MDPHRRGQAGRAVLCADEGRRDREREPRGNADARRVAPRTRVRALHGMAPGGWEARRLGRGRRGGRRRSRAAGRSRSRRARRPLFTPRDGRRSMEGGGLADRRTRGGRWCGGKRDARCDRARRSPFDARCSHPVRRPSRDRVGHCSAGRPGAGPPCARERRCPGGRWGCRSEADRRVLPRRYGAPRARRAGQERHRVRGESRFWRRLFGRDGVDAHRARACDRTA